MLVLIFGRFVSSLNFFNRFLATKGGVLRFLAFGYIKCWFDCRVNLGIRRTWRSSFLKHSMFNFNYISSAMNFHCFHSILLLNIFCGNKQNYRLFKELASFCTIGFVWDRFDAVIHFAGLKAVGESVANPRRYFDNNLIGTINLYEVMAKYDCKKVRPQLNFLN